MKRTGATYDVSWHGQQGGTLPLQPRMTRKTRAVVAAATWVALGSARSASAHQAPFSYLDVSVEPKGVHLTLVVHTFDLAHEVQVEPPERILEPDVLRSKSPIFASLLAERLSLTVDGARLVPSTWSAAEAVAERQSVRLEARIDLGRTARRIGIHAYLFPYDKVHQTFVNVYQGESIRTQAILDVRRQDFRVLCQHASRRAEGGVQVRARRHPPTSCSGPTTCSFWSGCCFWRHRGAAAVDGLGLYPRPQHWHCRWPHSASLALPRASSSRQSP